MDANTELIWYASYGSNINEERFYCYIIGGRPKYAKTNYLGCTDKTLPVANEELYIKSELYFANMSETWNQGGVSFLSNKVGPKSETWGRMYLITKTQFVQIFEQETGRQNVIIDFDKALKEDYVFAKRSWYGRIVYLGKQNGHPIFTFTNEAELTSTRPSPEYLNTIATGIKQCYSYSNDEIIEYLLDKRGVQNEYTPEQLHNLLLS